jgi:hypothetical protein
VTRDEEQPDHTADPRGTERSDQMPEDAPAEVAPDDDEDRSGEGSRSTGNPDAAG